MVYVCLYGVSGKNIRQSALTRALFPYRVECLAAGGVDSVTASPGWRLDSLEKTDITCHIIIGKITLRERDFRTLLKFLLRLHPAISRPKFSCFNSQHSFLFSLFIPHLALLLQNGYLRLDKSVEMTTSCASHSMSVWCCVKRMQEVRHRRELLSSPASSSFSTESCHQLPSCSI